MFRRSGDKALDPVRHVQATLTVDSLEAANAWLGKGMVSRFLALHTTRRLDAT